MTNRDERPAKENERDEKQDSAYESPRVVYRGRLEAYASVCNQKSGCATAST